MEVNTKIVNIILHLLCRIKNLSTALSHDETRKNQHHKQGYCLKNPGIHSRLAKYWKLLGKKNAVNSRPHGYLKSSMRLESRFRVAKMKAQSYLSGALGWIEKWSLATDDGGFYYWVRWPPERSPLTSRQLHRIIYRIFYWPLPMVQVL